jgi:histidine ammonia-lyase
MNSVAVDGVSLTVEEVEAVARRGARVALRDDPGVHDRIARSYALNQELMGRGMPIYGVTTGLGDSVDRHIGLDRAARLQGNLIAYLGCGVGDYMPLDDCRAMLLARVNCLAKGYSAVRPALIERLVDLLNRDIIPCVRSTTRGGAGPPRRSMPRRD